MRLDLRVKSYDLELLGERAREIGYGEIAHKALYFLPLLPKGYKRAVLNKEVKKALKRALALTDPRFREDFAMVEEFLGKILVKALLLPEVRPFFEEGVKAYKEIELQDEKGELHRVDRLVLTEQGPVVIDYKLGARRKEHIAQVKRYQKLLSKIYGQKVRAYLFYLEEPILLDIEQIKQQPLI